MADASLCASKPWLGRYTRGASSGAVVEALNPSISRGNRQQPSRRPWRRRCSIDRN